MTTSGGNSPADVSGVPASDVLNLSGPSGTLPYGVLPRLLLVWLSTETLRTRRTDLCFGATLSELLRHFGMNPDGRRYFALRRQLGFLAQTRLVMGFQRLEFDGYILSLPPLPITPEGREQPRGACSPNFHQVHLSPSYARTLAFHAVPLRWDAVWHLRSSSLAMDMYFWLSSRLYRLERDGLFLSWERLHAQFGHEYRTRDGVRLFRREVMRRLPDICRAYPAARIRPSSEGMFFSPSPPPVSPRERGWLRDYIHSDRDYCRD